MTDHELLHSIPTVGGGLSVKDLVDRLVSHGHTVNAMDLSEQLVKLAASHRLKRIGAYYWRVA